MQNQQIYYQRQQIDFSHSNYQTLDSTNSSFMDKTQENTGNILNSIQNDLKEYINSIGNQKNFFRAQIKIWGLELLNSLFQRKEKNYEKFKKYLKLNQKLYERIKDSIPSLKRLVIKNTIIKVISELKQFKKDLDRLQFLIKSKEGKKQQRPKVFKTNNQFRITPARKMPNKLEEISPVISSIRKKEDQNSTNSKRQLLELISIRPLRPQLRMRVSRFL